MVGWSNRSYHTHSTFHSFCFVAKVLVAVSLGLSLSLRNTMDRAVLWIKKSTTGLLRRGGAEEEGIS